MALFFFISLSLESKQGMSIMDFYKILPERFFQLKKMTLFNKSGFSNNEWFFRNKGMPDAPAIVDLENGYIEVTIGGSGFMQQQIALFRSRNGDSVIGIMESLSHIFLRKSRIIFLRWNGRNFLEVTNFIVPKHRHIFFSDTPNNIDTRIEELIKPEILFSYSLPRYGTSVECKISFESIQNLLSPRKNQERNPYRRALTEGEKKELYRLHKKIRIYEMNLCWDYEKGVFIIKQ